MKARPNSNLQLRLLVAQFTYNVMQAIDPWESIMVSSQDYLITVAQIAIAIAGFSSIVEALSTRHMQHWTELERFNFRLL